MKSGSSQPSHQDSLPTRPDEVRQLKSFFECLSILFLSSAAATIFRGGVFSDIFRNRLTCYHAFVVSTVFAFMGAYSALVFQRKHKPRVELFCRIYAMASMFSALAIVLYAAALWFVAPSAPLEH